MLFFIKKHPFSTALFTIIILLAAASYIFKDHLDLFGVFGSREALQSFIESFGFFAPLVLISLIIIEVVIAPLPGGVFSIAGGVVFGPVLGTLYAWIGNIVGSSLAFYIARRYGKSVVSFFMPSFEHTKARYDNEIRKNKFALFSLYVFPFVPVDVISFAVGLSSITYRQFIRAIALAFLIRMALWNTFGDAIGNILFVS